MLGPHAPRIPFNWSEAGPSIDILILTFQEVLICSQGRKLHLANTSLISLYANYVSLYINFLFLKKGK